jgi:nucleotide-binding universal stress UspA family protein
MDAQDSTRPVVVGVDGSDSALRAVRWGAAEAERLHAPLRLVSAFGGRAHPPVHPGLEGSYRDAQLGQARRRLAEAAEVARGEGLGIEVAAELVEGSPIKVLSGEADRAQLLVIGDRGLSRLKGLLVGSVAIGLAVHASCPLVVVRGDEREPAEMASLPVVVGVDGSATSDAALGFAMEAAASRSVPLVAVHTWSDMVSDPAMAAVMIDWDTVEAEERKVLSERVGAWTEKFPGVPVELLVVRDQPAQSLLEQASRGQLLVVGSRGHGQVMGLVLDSVGNALLHGAPCPVAIVRPETSLRT